jgi:uncharacterized protein YjdB
MRKASFVIAAVLVASCTDNPSRVTSPTFTPGAPRATVIAADGNPAPGDGDRVIIDTRTTLQQATTLAQAEALFRGNDHSPARSSAGGLGWSFVKNFDGAGTAALRADWPATKRCDDQTNRIIDYIPDPAPKMLYVQWKTRFGRTAADAGGNGAVDAFSIENTACPSASGYVMSLFRDNADDGGAGSLKMWYAGRPRATASLEQEALGGGLSDGNQGWTFAPSQFAGKVVKFTVFVQAASSPKAHDGVVRVWINGSLYFEQTNLALGAQAISRFEFPGWRFGTIATSEYFWDVVAWASDPLPASKIVVAPNAPSVSVGNKAQLTATAYDARGNAVPVGDVKWSSSAEKVAKVDDDGTVTAKSAGTTTITASSGKLSGSTVVTVKVPVPTTIVVKPGNASIDADEKVQLAATVLDADGSPMKADVKWNSADPKIAKVDDDGTVTGRSAGTVQVTASLAKLNGSSTITVTTPGRKVGLAVTLVSTSLVPGQTTQAAATFRTPIGTFSASALPKLVWSSSNVGVATVSPTGLVTAVGSGSANIVAKAEDFSGQATLTVVALTTSGTPMPTSTSKILLDTRAGGAQSFSNVSNVNDALRLFARPGDGVVDATPVRPAKDSSGWSFTTNADGNGLHALRVDWTKSSDPCTGDGCHDEGIRLVHYLPDGGPTRGGTPTREVFVQWKNRLGRYAFDVDANGPADSYSISLPSGSCKRALFSNADDYRRVDFALTRGASPIGAQLEVNDQGYAFEAPTDRWNLDQVVGANVRPYTTTMHVVAASSDAVRDGLVELWVDGTQVFSVHDVPMSAEAFDRWEFPTICVSVPQPQSEYLWDIVVWKP